MVGTCLGIRVAAMVPVLQELAGYWGDQQMKAYPIMWFSGNGEEIFKTCSRGSGGDFRRGLKVGQDFALESLDCGVGSRRWYPAKREACINGLRHVGSGK